ncbi:hypothetical protein V8F44DRAFT_595091, partial [Aspergillus fumigatus]
MMLFACRGGHGLFEFFPLERKLRLQQPSDVVLIDVGGAQGRDLRQRVSTLPGKACPATFAQCHQS